MAKIRVAQIKDLSLVNGKITIGDQEITPLESIVANPVTENSVLTGLIIAQDGKTINTTSVTKSDLLQGLATTTEVTNAISTAIDGLDKPAFSLVELNGTTLNGFTIAENNGIIEKGTTATSLLEFATAPTATNKVATIADITNTLTGNYVTTDAFNTYQTTVENTYAKIADLTKLTTRVTTAEGTITTQGEAISELKGRMSTAEGTITTQGESIDALAGRMSTAEDDIDALEEAVAGLGNYNAGSGIKITDERVISTTVTLNYNSTDNVIQLLDKANGNVIGTVDAKAFLKDGMVSSATVVTNPEGQTEGTYIKLTFNTQDPVSGEASHEDIFINVTSLIDVYTAGNDGIEVAGRKISHKAGVLTADTQKGAVSENTIKVPVVKVDGYGHVIALTEAEWTMPVSTALESVSGADSDFITVTVGNKDENKNQEITATAAIGSFETNGANGLATTDAVKIYVEGQLTASATKHVHLEQIVENATADTTSVTIGYTQTPINTNKENFDVYQNGLKLKAGEYRIENNSVIITPETTVGVKTGDEFEVCYVAKA